MRGGEIVAQEQKERFNDLKKLYFKNLLNQDFNESEFNNIENQVRIEYNSLLSHITSVIHTLKGKNQSITVAAKSLHGKYVIKPNFRKVIQKAYIYKQVQNNKFNNSKKAAYLGQVFNLDEEYTLKSKVKLDTSSLFPYIYEEVSNSSNAFIEEEHIIIPAKQTENDIISTHNYLYTFLNYSQDEEYEIEVNDIQEVLIHLGYPNIQVYQQGRDFIADQEIDSQYFECELSENTRIRVAIESLQLKDNALDDVDYFFEELEGRFYIAVDKEGSEKEEAHVVKRDRSQQILIIEKPNKTEFSNPFNFLLFDISLSNLYKQRKVLDTLINKPKLNQKNLIKIIYSNSVFSNQLEYPINRFYFLKNLEYEGTQEQRSFVKKALATDDFMILSGPPGTGKTTAIIEFIIQAIKKNPKTKILLSASTHIAIDNVLENFFDIFGKDFYKENLYPIRVGTSETISSQLDDFSHERIKEKYGIGVADLYLYSSNLVCGTTMGIAKYIDGTDLEFDYLIIDEASKTTLQEFIVPAAMCHKYIIVGDVNQLSPYTDTFMLETILKSNENVNSTKANHAYYNYVLHKLKESEQSDFVVVIDSKETVRVMSTWFDGDYYSFIYQNEHVESLFDNKRIVIWKQLYNQWQSFIPARFRKILTVHEQPDYIKLKMPNKIHDFSDKLETLRETSDNQIGSNWAKEVAWRYVRYHELKKNDKTFEKELDWLIPEQIKGIKQDIDQLADITIPSVLIKLQEGVKTRNHKSISNRFRTGFTTEEKESRFVQLIYQHRMHSKISKYAEVSIYDNNLKTARTVDIKRSNLPLFPYHNIMVDVKSNKMCKSENEKEAIEISRLLKLIIDRYGEMTQPIKVGVLTFYKAQERLIKSYVGNMLKPYGIEVHSFVKIKNIEIEIYTVDKFQGKESDISIISLSRNKGLGFMNVPNRINVAMTRAKYYRIVVGDAEHFRSFDQQFLRNIVLYSQIYKEGELI